MIAVCKSESGLENKRSVNQNTDGSFDHGVCQLNDRWHQAKVGGSIEGFYDIRKNIKAAKEIRVGWQGFTAWSNFKNGRYLSFMPK